MRFILIVISFLAIATLAGCATLSQAQCKTGDWQSIGEFDGRSGHPIERFSEHIEACGSHGIVPDREAYNNGRAVGLQSYCTLQNAVKIGMAGRRYYNVCEGEIGISFVRVYREANDVGTLQSEISSILGNIESLSEKLAEPTLTQPERDQIVWEIKSLNRTIAIQQESLLREDAELRQVLLEEQKRLAD